MVAKELAYWVVNPNEITKEDCLTLEHTAQVYPYCQIISSLLAKGYSLQGKEDIAAKKIGLAAAHAINRDGLRKVITGTFVNKLTWVNPVPLDEEVLPERQEVVLVEEEVIQEEVVLKKEEIPEDVPPQLPTIPKKASFVLKKDEQLIKQKQALQLSIIDEFIVKSPGLIRSTKGKALNISTEDLSMPSVTIAEEIVTESYANILEMQGQKEKAIVVYEKLILKFPEKKGYFANRIAALS